MNRILFSALLVAFLSSFAYAQECAIDPVLGADLRDDVKADVTFQDQGDRTVLINLATYSTLDRQAMLRRYRGEVAGQLPSNECGRNVTLLGTSNRIQSRDWHLRSGVRARQYLCLKTKGTCCKWLKCRACEWKWIDENIGLRKTLDLETWVTPRIVEASTGHQISVDARSTLEELEQWEKDLLNTLKNLAGVLEISTIGLINTKDYFDISLPSVPTLNIFREQFIGMDNFKPEPTNATFDNGKYGFSVRVDAQDVRACAVARQVRRYFASLDEIRYQTSDAERRHVVAEGETLWSIAEQEYGDGRYFKFIENYNDTTNPDLVSVGQEIGLPTIGRMTNRFQYEIAPGDTVWALTGSDEERQALTGYIKSLGRDPSLIYPLDGFIPK
ncbi:LysM peptidoglycan-binding domain-containing protein [Pseudophaeobacter sp. 1A16562]|uniref:LysM peptidoglycan-binding domain-containing protein n=1 Tax=Pseudophaeobacter sp. 1A16562 TaxID=3098143 RepID=UPI0034D52B94